MILRWHTFSLLWLVLLFVQQIAGNTEIVLFNQNDPAFTVAALDGVSDSQVLTPLKKLSLKGPALPNTSLTWLYKLDVPSANHLASKSVFERGIAEILGRSGRWTLRISWPALLPTDFTIKLGRLSHKELFAQITAQRTGVYAHDALVHMQPDSVPYTLLLEPIYCGFIPHTALRLLAFLAALLTITAAMRLPQRIAAFIASQHVEKTKTI